MRLVKLACGLLLGVLPGCVVIDARQSTVVYHTTEVKSYQSTSTTTVEKDKPQPIAPPVIIKPEVSTERAIVQAGCKPFVLPTRQSLPVQPDFNNIGDAELETVIASYIKELKALIRLERKTLDDAHRLHLSGCKG
jgi:hypothetical protein